MRFCETWTEMSQIVYIIVTRKTYRGNILPLLYWHVLYVQEVLSIYIKRFDH